MELGLGLYSETLTEENFRFAQQLGVTRIVAHTPGEKVLPSTREGYWSYEDLKRLCESLAPFDLKLEAIENFLPHHWDQILLAGPGREAQMERLKMTIRNMGRAGIPIMGYYFSLAGVWGRVSRPFARGGAVSSGFIESEAPEQTPIPHGEAWGQKVIEDPPDGDIGAVTHDEMWERLAWFLERLVPVAEESGVRLAAHPDDPPLPILRGTARLITHPDDYQRLLDLVPSPSNAIEFCQGTITEMPGSDVYEAIRRYASQDKICYVHFRNVRGKAPNYCEVFIDEGDVDMIKALRIYEDSGFEGLLIPDHTPQMSCAAPWHAGMAFAIGYLKAALKMI